MLLELRLSFFLYSAIFKSYSCFLIAKNYLYSISIYYVLSSSPDKGTYESVCLLF